MSSSSRRADFFVLEAAEYVQELGQLVARRDGPDAERLVRGARALRGAALMAGLGTFARAAASLEALARAVRDHAIAWDPHAHAGWQEGLATLRGLIGRAPQWEAADDRQALALAERIERIAGGSVPSESAVTPASVLTPGVRAFIARESVLIAGSLEQAARALAPVPPPAALSAVLERMRALRGLGASSDLSPLPELLDAMEVATRTLLADHPAPPDAADVFTDAAHALAAMARMVADHGRVTPPTDLDGVARRLLESYAAERDVVPVATLAPDGAESIVRPGTPPGIDGDAEPVPVELVSVGDHLLITADALAAGGTPAARDLRLFVLHRTLRTMPPRSGTARFLAPINDAICTAIARGMPTGASQQFLTLLRDCGKFLLDAGALTDRTVLTTRRDAVLGRGGPVTAPSMPVPTALITATAAGLTPEGFAGATAPAPPPGDDVVPIASLAPDAAGDDDIVPIASLAPDDEVADDVVPIESLAPALDIPAVAPGAPSLLESAFRRRAELDAMLPDDAPSLDRLIGVEIVDIATLLYRGPAALGRAEELRAEIGALLARGDVGIAALRPALDELLDLLPLARDAA